MSVVSFPFVSGHLFSCHVLSHHVPSCHALHVLSWKPNQKTEAKAKEAKLLSSPFVSRWLLRVGAPPWTIFGFKSQRWLLHGWSYCLEGQGGLVLVVVAVLLVLALVQSFVPLPKLMSYWFPLNLECFLLNCLLVSFELLVSPFDIIKRKWQFRKEFRNSMEFLSILYGGQCSWTVYVHACASSQVCRYGLILNLDLEVLCTFHCLVHELQELNSSTPTSSNRLDLHELQLQLSIGQLTG